MLATPLGEEMDRDGDDKNTSHMAFAWFVTKVIHL